MNIVTTSHKASTFQRKLRERILEVLEREPLSQQKFADRAGVSLVTLNRFLQGHSSLSAEAEDRCAFAAGCRKDLVIAGFEENFSEPT